MGLFYFSGHGLQIDDTNYLTGIDTDFTSDSTVKYSAINLDLVIDIMDRAALDVKILILDCCRNNPLKKQYRGQLASGLAPVFAPKGTLVAFSTSPGQTALDGGGGNNSIYTKALLNHIEYPYIPIEEFFKRVRTTVFNLTGGKQISWEHTSLIGNYHFNFGQRIASPTLPYSISVVKDGLWQSTGSLIDVIIEQMKTQNWDIQGPAIGAMEAYNDYSAWANDQLFLLGRNLLQMANGPVYRANDIFNGNLATYLHRFFHNGVNHVLNGILYEIYYDSKGEFRKHGFKNRFIDSIYRLQAIDEFKSSFLFIREQLLQINFQLIYIPDDPPVPLAIEVILKKEPAGMERQIFGRYMAYTHSLVSVKYGLNEMLHEPTDNYSYQINDFDFIVSQLASILCAPSEMLSVNCNITDNKDLNIRYHIRWTLFLA